MATRWQQNYQLYRRYVRNLALMYQKRQDIRAFTELLLSLSAITIFGAFAIRPTLVTVLDLNGQIAGKRETVRLLDTKIQALAEAQEVYDRNRVSLPLVDIAIPTNPSPELYARQIEGLANRHSLSILDMNTKDVLVLGTRISGVEVVEDDAEEAADTTQVTGENFEFELTAVGSFEGVRAFLGDFESLRRAMLEDTVNIRLTQGELPGDIAISIKGRLAYLPNEQ